MKKHTIGFAVRTQFKFSTKRMARRQTDDHLKFWLTTVRKELIKDPEIHEFVEMATKIYVGELQRRYGITKRMRRHSLNDVWNLDEEKMK